MKRAIALCIIVVVVKVAHLQRDAVCNVFGKISIFFCILRVCSKQLTIPGVCYECIYISAILSANFVELLICSSDLILSSLSAVT